jgi:hypothetical protein
MDEVKQAEKPAPLIEMSGQRLVQVIGVGAAVGLAAWGLAYVLENYVLQALMCHGSVTIRCVAEPQYADAMASILAAGIGLFGLVRLQVFRPLLTVLATTLSLWGLLEAARVSFPYGVGVASIFLYALSYGLFAWIARIRLFWLTVILTLSLLIIVRLILTA